jgi:hypothetical protein
LVAAQGPPFRGTGIVAIETSAADFEVLRHAPQTWIRNFKSKANTGIIDLLAPFSFPKFVREDAIPYHCGIDRGTRAVTELRRRSLDSALCWARGAENPRK